MQIKLGSLVLRAGNFMFTYVLIRAVQLKMDEQFFSIYFSLLFQSVGLVLT